VRVVIVDDEPLARRGVRARPAAVPDMEIVAECATGEEAVTTIQALAPDLVFLDIQMPDLNGFDVLRRLPAQQMPLVVFLTAYDRYALEAFEAQALDYLLKPIEDTRFMRALERARLLRSSHRLAEIENRIRGLLESLQERGSRPRYRTHMTVKTGRRVTIVDVMEIDWIGGAGDYVTLHAGGKDHLVRQTIGSLERELDPEHFLRIHRSTIVQTSRIAELVTLENGEFLVRLRNGKELGTSRSYSRRLEEWL
jgi:two-component system, LytTR family, response regulator